MSDILALQEYLYHGLLSCDLFAPFNVVLERKFLAQQELEFSAIWQAPREGQNGSGIGLYIEMPRLEVPKPNSLQRNLVASIVVIEERNLNMTDGVGTQVSAEDLAERALDFMFGWMLGLSSGLTPESGAILPASDVIQGDGLVVYRAAVSLRREHRAIARCDAPGLTVAGDNSITLANGQNTPDAEIFFTCDGTFPGKANPAAARYTAPLALVAGQRITWAAYRPDRLPSHLQSRTLT